MVRCLTGDVAEAARGLDRMVEAAVAGGAPEPSWLAVDGDAAELARLFASETGAERARGVVATSNDRTLSVAHHLGIGGAIGLPPSSLGVAEALHAAASAPAPTAVNPCVPQLLEGAGELRIVAVADRLFWQAQIGTAVLTRLLAELAEALGAPQVLVPWPALVVAGIDEAEIRAAWQPLASGPGRPVHDLVVASFRVEDRDCLAAAYRTLVEPSVRGDREMPQPEPVYELPGGAMVGSWAPRGEGGGTEGWLATPEEPASLCCWQLRGPDESLFAQDVLEAETIDRLDGAAAARVPGSMGGALRRGRPAGLLIQRLAEAAHRRGLPLWIPNVDREGLKLALRLPGTLWIDGPAVPR